jgi:hypothetical protein
MYRKHILGLSKGINAFPTTFGGSISGERAPPQYCNTGELEELIFSACLTAL